MNLPKELSLAYQQEIVHKEKNPHLFHPNNTVPADFCSARGTPVGFNDFYDPAWRRAGQFISELPAGYPSEFLKLAEVKMAQRAALDAQARQNKHARRAARAERQKRGESISPGIGLRRVETMYNQATPYRRAYSEDPTGERERSEAYQRYLNPSYSEHFRGKTSYDQWYPYKTMTTNCRVYNR